MFPFSRKSTLDEKNIPTKPLPFAPDESPGLELAEHSRKNLRKMTHVYQAMDHIAGNVTKDLEKQDSVAEFAQAMQDFRQSSLYLSEMCEETKKIHLQLQRQCHEMADLEYWLDLYIISSEKERLRQHKIKRTQELETLRTMHLAKRKALEQALQQSRSDLVTFPQQEDEIGVEYVETAETTR
ncbi:uncharacterized protein MONOS_6200 [Monocercomonoides exilis]|uniref:uncharacterized protein n=1 Tax=Monocercomonoides exilis TaxID=2049356 RepID=UPI0035595DF4|nr:hypothetical protein MONOS_6200 [Monocercomonoides exilis]|eukprot:MONOS_6200.1-p1 / transcript=MONOS_6200.1 / gene=MONOS_6200 / organism=Monocercomonoides_exilis_PA203 / gene_product=unspecified product / transcript_product=unspecified product / location=Mono_scaffold00192:32784-33569(-) / protein_length=183 / sequence_SO=supercontig / SO=protein_coding / is_pseudo=false